jgi:magnesium transporter
MVYARGAVMLRSYLYRTDRLIETECPDGPGTTPQLVWIDLLNPTQEEDARVEKYLGISIPTRDEMQEIELSDRLYHEQGAEFMTMTALSSLDLDEPIKTPVTFIIKDTVLVTVRYADSKPFQTYAARAQRAGGTSCATGELVMLGIIETLVDRTADALERIGDDIDLVSREVFRKKGSSATRATRDLQAVIEQIGHKGDLLTKIRESLVSLGRMIAYHNAIDLEQRKLAKESRQRVRLIQRDAIALGEHAAFLSSKITFLLDATLGLINLEQNQIIKIFSVAAVVFLPPTLVASIYGMNFSIMPELHLPFGYPLAIGLMVLSAIAPYLYFKRRGWL